MIEMAAPGGGREEDLIQQSSSQSRRIRMGSRLPCHGPYDSQDTLGQFSFAPATQTTVITTTTTTTTKFPPFMMRAPQKNVQLDSKLYPLATTQTPSALKTIRFVHQGREALFREAPDTSIALEEVSCSISPFIVAY